MYEQNGPPQPQTVGFRDLVRPSIAPVSKKGAVKMLSFIKVLDPFLVSWVCVMSTCNDNQSSTRFSSNQKMVF